MLEVLSLLFYLLRNMIVAIITVLALSAPLPITAYSGN